MNIERCPPRQPLFWAAMAFSAGIFLGTRTWRPPSWWVVSALVFAAAAVWFLRGRPWLAKALSLGCWILIGAFLVQVRGHPAAGDHAIYRVANDREVTILAHVTREGYPRLAGPQTVREPIDVETESVETESGTESLRAGVRLTIYSKTDASAATLQDAETSVAASRPPAFSQIDSLQFSYGTRLRIRAKLHLPRNFGNPGAFDYEGYLRDNGIAVLGSARSENVERLPGFTGSRLERWRARIHASIVEKVHRLWPEPQAALMDAMVLGEDSFLRNSSRIEFQRSGTYHILVVSGMNLSILAFVIFWVLRQFRMDASLASIFTVIASFAYAFVTDVGPPVWRAVLMLSLFLGARFLYRERSMLNAIGAAAIGVLPVDPRALLGASFQLTFLSVLLIAGIGVPLLERTSLPYVRGLRLLPATSYDLNLAPNIAQFRLDVRMTAERLARFVGMRAAIGTLRVLFRFLLGTYELVLISLLMQIGLAMPMAYYFHRATSMGLPANLVVVPLTEILMPAAAAAVGMSYVSVTLARPAAWISGIALSLITGTVHRLGALPSADLRVAVPIITVVILALITIALAIACARRPAPFATISLASMVLVALWIVLVPSRAKVYPRLLEMTSIDVGQGDSTLLVMPDGPKILVDAGGLPLWMHSDFDVGEQVVSSYLWARGIDRIDIAVITHAHADHIGGMPSVIANFHPRELWLSTDAPTGELAPVLMQAKRMGIPTRVLKEGDDFDFGGARFHVFAPARDPRTGVVHPNDDSLAFSISVGSTTALLEGDAERAVEQRIAAQRPRATLLKVAHHGSASVTSPEILAAVQPTLAVISSGLRNVYGHPRREVLDRLAGARVITYRTDLMGAITFYLDGTSVRPELALTH